MKILDQISEFISGDKSVQMVADDIHLTSELILLVRVMFADGELKPEELENFKNICVMAFGITKDEVVNVIAYLNDIGYETTAGDAARMFSELDMERKRALLIHMFSIAKADDILDPKEVDLIRRTAGILGLTPDDISTMTQEIS